MFIASKMAVRSVGVRTGQRLVPEHAAFHHVHHVEHGAGHAVVGAQAVALGAGKPCEWSPVMTLYSRSTACADASSFPGGLRRMTYFLVGVTS